MKSERGEAVTAKDGGNAVIAGAILQHFEAGEPAQRRGDVGGMSFRAAYIRKKPQHKVLGIYRFSFENSVLSSLLQK